jgi:hypothetical protein
MSNISAKFAFDVLGDLNRALGRLYSNEGRPSIPPEQLLSALLLQVTPAGFMAFRQLEILQSPRIRPRSSELWTTGLSQPLLAQAHQA